jgi:hypothetical protein
MPTKHGASLIKYLHHLHAPQRLTDNNFAGTIDAVNLKNVLGQIQADRGNFHGGWLPMLVVA